ncbi:MAG TPA: hypothetical protein VIT88_04095 [Pyrinomonadaceae bacterium]
MPPITEHGFVMELQHFGFGYGASGGITTITEDFFVFPGLVSIQTGLSRVAALQATIGIAEFTAIDHGRGQSIVFNNHAEWPPWLMRRISHYTIGGNVVGGIMKGWWTLNAWS